LRPFALFALAAIVAGCAGSSAYEQGMRLQLEGKPALALVKLEEAMKANPKSAEIRSAYFRQRDALVAQYLVQGDTARAAQQAEQAEAAYRRALELDPGNVRAEAGIASLAGGRRREEAIAEAELALKSGDLAAAEALARNVLAEDPGSRAARNLMRRLKELQARGESAPPSLKAALNRSVTLEFRDSSLRSIFDVLSRTAGLNFVFDKDVRADTRTTVFVRNSNLDDVIKLVLVTNQLERKVINENSMLIYPNTPAKLKEYQELVVRRRLPWCARSSRHATPTSTRS